MITHGYLLLFGVELEALVQSAAVLLDMLLMLIPHTLCVLHHLLVNITKQAAASSTKLRLHKTRRKRPIDIYSGV